LSILPNSSQIKALLCDILHLEGRKISKNKYGGRQPKKFENPWVKHFEKQTFYAPDITFDAVYSKESQNLLATSHF
jgi:hypothetical protein